MRPTTTRTISLLAVAALTALAGCGSDQSAGPSASPSAEQRKVVLLTHDSFALSKDVMAEFTKSTGYELTLVQPGDAGVTLNQAILQKQNPVADVMFGIDNTFLSRGLDEGIFEPYSPAAASQIPDELRQGTDGVVTPIDRGDVCVVLDKRYFEGAGKPPAPQTLDDLTKPEYRDLTVVENPSVSSPGLSFLLATIAAKGQNPSSPDGVPAWQSYWSALRDNGVTVVDGWTEAYEGEFSAGGGNGKRPIVVSYATGPAADIVFSNPKRDKPHVAVMDQTCFQQIEYAGVLAGARNPAGARAWIDYMLSERVQADIPLQMFVYPVVPGTPIPAVFEKWAATPADPWRMEPKTIGERRDEWIRQWTDVMAR